MNDIRILIINNDKVLLDSLKSNFEEDGYTVDIARTAFEALSKTISDFQLLITDVVCGEISGFKLVRNILNNPDNSLIPIIFLTSNSNENDRLTAFSVGATDYITIPFSKPELLARIKVILQRSLIKSLTTADILSFEDLKMNITNKQVFVSGTEVQFTKKEFEILKLFLENKNQLFTRMELLSMVWPEEAFVLGRTVDVNIVRIRHKIGIYKKQAYRSKSRLKTSVMPILISFAANSRL